MKNDRIGDTSSLLSSVTKYRKENGRTYHAYRDGKYLLPNDEKEIAREWILHTVFDVAMGGRLFLSPLGPNPRHVLDVGTGSGLWAIDYADANPETKVIGTDLSPIQPDSVPPNLIFEVDDAEDEWAFGHKFDFIHGRVLTTALADWPRFMEQSFENLEPGGWLEIQEIIRPYRSDDGTLLPDSALAEWSELCIQAAHNLDHPYTTARMYKRWMKAAGFVNIRQERFKLPTNPWPRDRHYQQLGLYNMQNLLEGAHGFSVAMFTRGLGWASSEVEVFLVKVRRELQDRNIHAYVPM
ncbi:MAG: hypothetical protein M1819_001761 [Sarea resinae]|nr:MAG: hypothetical protein M1819_001761 [Sarea resinae]